VSRVEIARRAAAVPGAEPRPVPGALTVAGS
jgi:hypothetical protein